jgi:phage shock protein C
MEVVMDEHLYRSRDDRMLAGVAGGLAEIWDADPSLIRIVWALLVVLTGGLALLLYIIMAIVVPEDDASPAAPAPAAPTAPETPAAPGFDSTAQIAVPSVATATVAATDVPAIAPPPVTDARAARRAARAERRAARRARGGDRTVGVVIGALLVLVGAAFLLREWLPAIDFDWFWPLVLVGLGVALLVVGFTRGSGRTEP